MSLLLIHIEDLGFYWPSTTNLKRKGEGGYSPLSLPSPPPHDSGYDIKSIAILSFYVVYADSPVIKVMLYKSKQTSI